MSAINFCGGSNNEQIHKHKNMPVLDQLDESVNGNLSYKGKEIITSSEDKTVLATQVIETEDRKFLNRKEKDSLSGITGNIQSQINIVKLLASESMRFKGRFNSYSDMNKSIPIPSTGDTVFIDTDETQSNAKTIYICKDLKWFRVRKDDNSSGWIASSTEPTNKNVLWVDISNAEPKIKWFNGSIWVNISGLTTVPASKVQQEPELKFVNSNSDNILKKLTVKNDILYFDGKPIGESSSVAALIKDDLIEIDSTFSSFKISEELKSKQTNLGFVPENISRKGMPNGYAPLDSNTKIEKKFLNDYSFIRNTVEEMDLITGVEPGNTCYVESTTETYVYTMSKKWSIASRGNSVSKGRNNYEGNRNPIASDDISIGYNIGSIWINSITKKAFICTSEIEDSAIWELMAGSVTLNIGEIIPFKINKDMFIEHESKKIFEIPNVNSETDFIELSINGKELMQKSEFEIINVNNKSYVLIAHEITDTDHIFGEIYKHDITKAEQQMLKSVYDSNNNGKVDLSEIADKTCGFNQWKENVRYNKEQVILIDKSLYVCNATHTSATTIDMLKWNILISEAKDLNKFSTDNLVPTNLRNYVTNEQIVDINNIKSLNTRVNTNEKNILANTIDVSSLKDNSLSLKNRLDTLKFINLIDTPSSLSSDAILRINESGDKIILDNNPLFATKRIIDSKNREYTCVDTSKYANFEMINQTEEGIFEFKLDASAIELSDMPKNHEHGKILVSDENNGKFVLADKESLTMSIENFSEIITENDWEEVNGKFEKTIFHNMKSENIIPSFTDILKKEDKDISYEILDDENVKVISSSRKYIKCVFNCALGAGNGYWQYLMDWSKIDFVDDTKIRTDRAYSSSKFEETIKNYALKADYYNKNVSDTKYAIKEKEHDHINKSVIDDLKEKNGSIYYKEKKLLTELMPITYSSEQDFETEINTQILNIENIYMQYRIQAILASEILIKNNSITEDANIKIMDSNFDLIDVTLKPGEVQKYHLGISNKIKIFAKGKVKTLLTVSAF